jgi:hypothetical protein
MDILQTQLKRPLWVRAVQFVDALYCKRKYNAMLRQRSFSSVSQKWRAVGIDLRLVTKVSSIIADECDWANSLFVPEDEATVLFWSRDTDLGDVNALIRLADEHLIMHDYFIVQKRLAGMAFGDFIVCEVAPHLRADWDKNDSIE